MEPKFSKALSLVDACVHTNTQFMHAERSEDFLIITGGGEPISKLYNQITSALCTF